VPIDEFVGIDGVLILDKPAGWTSHDAVNKVRRMLGGKPGVLKVGHLGTLDPMATGVLPLLLGRATRLAQFMSGGRKCYDAWIRFGFATTTYDREGDTVEPHCPVHLESAMVESWLGRFRGAITQTPPAVSAKKIQGVPAYKLARRNEPVELKPIEVEVFRLDLLACEDDRIHVEVECSPGTYIRSLAHDLGRLAGCGAHLDSLRRLAAEPFRVDRAVTMDAALAAIGDGSFPRLLVPLAGLLPEMASAQVDDETALLIRQGREFRLSPFRPRREERYVKAMNDQGDLIAIGEIRMPNVYQPVVVLQGAG
jgi:tRNA pseudouridine55 synthase